MNPWFISCEISYVHAVFSLLIRKAQKYPVLFPYHPDKNIIAYSALIYNERWMYQILLRFLSGKRSIKCGFQSKKLDKSSNKPLFIGFFRWHPTWHFYLVEVRRFYILCFFKFFYIHLRIFILTLPYILSPIFTCRQLSITIIVIFVYICGMILLRW